MKSLILTALVVLASQAALADHSLTEAMSEQPKIAKAVKDAILNTNEELYCVTNKSMQISPKNSKIKDTYSVWRQVAICFDNVQAADEFETAGSNSNGGIYGFMGKAILDITYNRSTGTVYKISVK